jgi:hypothetical protein
MVDRSFLNVIQYNIIEGWLVELSKRYLNFKIIPLDYIIKFWKAPLVNFTNASCVFMFLVHLIFSLYCVLFKQYNHSILVHCQVLCC